MGKFVITSRKDIDNVYIKRAGEIKLGETVQTIETEDWVPALKQSTAKFVLLGIPENIGVRANNETATTHLFWEPALKAILNLQHNKALQGESLLVLGAFDFNTKMGEATGFDTDELRNMVAYIDDAVFPFIQKIINAGKIPIVVGGGHNNCYPILKGVSEAKNTPVNCINLDAQSDFSAMDGRHSGNGFRYAHRKGYLNKYAVVGLHESYNSGEIMEELMDDPDLCFSYYEDIFIREKLSFYEAVNFALARTGRPAGLEIDLNAVNNTSGVNPLLARQFVTWCTKELNPLYLHLAEGTANAATATVAANLIADFIKAYKKK